MTNKLRWGLYFLIFLSLNTKLFRLDQPPKFYFDEVYHGYTAARYLHSEVEAYDPWGKHAEGMANEWTHPPLAKLLMAGFMQVVGENAFGWRVGSALFGTAAVALTVLLALELGLSGYVALMAGFLLCIDGLHFVQSRIAMNDSYFVFFQLLALFFYVKWRKTPKRTLFLIWTGIGLGCAAATKWTTLWVYGLIAADSIAQKILYKRRLIPKEQPVWKLILAFIVIPAAIYVASYLQMFALGMGWDRFIEVQKQMWWYHSGLKATHSYQSRPWQWILDLRPVWMSATPSPEGKVTNIYNTGNPFILWAGLLCILYQAADRKNWTPTRIFLFVAYFMLWVPWTFSPRIMLFYHYTPAIPFLCTLLAISLENLSSRQLPKHGTLPFATMTVFLAVLWILSDAPIAVPAFLIGTCIIWNQLKDSLVARQWMFWGFPALCLVWFAIFFPNLVGLPVSSQFAERVYFAIPGWK